VRLDHVDVTPTPAVAMVPNELMLAFGVKALIAPLVAGLCAFGLLFLVSALSHDAEREREDGHDQATQLTGVHAAHLQSAGSGEQPHGLKTVLGVLWAASVIAAIAVSMSFLTVLAVAIGTLLVATVGYLMIVASTGVAGQATALFAITALAGGVLALVFEAAGPATKLDLAVAVRTSGATIPGYFLGRSGDQHFLETANSPATSVTPDPAAPQDAIRDDAQLCRPEAIRYAAGDCYVQQLTAIPADDVARFMVGPGAVEVGPTGFRSARALARRAALGIDQYEPPPALKKPKKKGCPLPCTVTPAAEE
jgi:hypothetical protein